MKKTVLEQHEPQLDEASVESIELLVEEAGGYLRSNPARLQELTAEIERQSTEIGYNRGMVYAGFYTGCILYLQSRFEEALPYYSEALEKFGAMQNTTGVCSALRYLGLSHYLLCRYEQALDFYRKELDMRQRHLGDDVLGIAGTMTNIATAHLLLGHHDIALQHYLQVLISLEDHKDTTVYISTLSNISNVYMALNDFEQAMEYLTRVLAMYQQKGDESGEANTMLNLGWNYMNCGKYEQALECNNRALELYEKMENVKKVGVSLFYIGETHSRMQHHKQAFELFQRSYKISHDVGDKKNCMDVFRAMGDILSTIEDYELAKEYYLCGLEIAKETKMGQMEYELYELLAKIEERSGNDKAALGYYREYMRIKETVMDERRRQSIGEMQMRFNVEQSEKEKEIYRLRNVELAGALESVEQLNRHLSEANEEKNELLGIVAHDLKNPISGLSMSLSMLSSYIGRMTQRDVLYRIDVMNRTVQRMGEIVFRLLDLNLLESGKMVFQPDKFDLNDMMRTALEEFNGRMEEKRITGRCELAPDVLPVYADRGAVLEVLDNLISNAVKYSPYDTAIVLRSLEAGTKVRFEIEDSGPGIDPADYGRLFRKFVKLSAQPTGGESSTGLGLSIVKKLVEAMNGQVWCERGAGGGALFVVELPASRS